jgi:predicted nucleic acid-binding Zn ribbon protein
LLAKAGITAKVIAQHSVNQQSWQIFLEKTLPTGLAAHICGISLQQATLTVMADSPGWAVRLRYALEEALPRIREKDTHVQKLLVKVAGR